LAESNTVQQDDSSNEEDNITVLVKKFEKFLQQDKKFKFGNKRIFHKKNDASTSK